MTTQRTSRHFVVADLNYSASFPAKSCNPFRLMVSLYRRMLSRSGMRCNKGEYQLPTNKQDFQVLLHNLYDYETSDRFNVVSARRRCGSRTRTDILLVMSQMSFQLLVIPRVPHGRLELHISTLRGSRPDRLDEWGILQGRDLNPHSPAYEADVLNLLHHPAVRTTGNDPATFCL